MTTDTETMNEKLARLCPAQKLVGIPLCRIPVFREGVLTHYRNIPDYENSYDAQDAPGGPAELARKRGWRLFSAANYDPQSGAFVVGLVRDSDRSIVRGQGPTLASAFAEAYTKALEAGE